MFSFWENQHFKKFDYIIIGSGFVGLSTAIAVKKKKPDCRIAIIERGMLPTGGSTKNAGFACFGSLTELLSDIEEIGESNTLALVEKRWRGLTKLKERLGLDKLDYKSYGGYELITEKELPALDKLVQINNQLRPIFKKDVFSINPEKISEFGFNEKYVKSLVFNSFEGQIDTGLTVKSLLTIARNLDIEIFTGTEFIEFEEMDFVKVFVRHLDKKAELNCDQLIFCTSAFSSQFFKYLDVVPGRGQVLVTKPIEGLKFKGTFHYDEGFYYFRDYYDRVIFGGGRNQDFEAEKTYELNMNDKILKDLKSKLKTIILPDQEFEIEQTWSGLMDFGNTKMPFLKRVSDRVVIGCRLAGMGVAISSLMGEEIAEMID